MSDEARVLTKPDRGWSQLMAAAQAGDGGAYARLLREILPFIRVIAARWHGGSDRIDEVVQDVLLTIHKVRHTYDPGRPFEHWLAMIARRRAIDALRRRTRRQALEVSDPTAYETFADPRANRMADAAVTADGLEKAIARLPPQQREAIELLKLRELSLAEASRLTGRSVGALKVNVHRAIKALRVRLSGE